MQFKAMEDIFHFYLSGGSECVLRADKLKLSSQQITWNYSRNKGKIEEIKTFMYNREAWVRWCKCMRRLLNKDTELLWHWRRKYGNENLFVFFSRFSYSCFIIIEKYFFHLKCKEIQSNPQHSMMLKWFGNSLMRGNISVSFSSIQRNWSNEFCYRKSIAYFFPSRQVSAVVCVHWTRIESDCSFFSSLQTPTARYE